MKVYISGPMTGIPEYNFPAFHEAAQRLRENGYEAINPAEGVTDTRRPWEYYMRRALGLLNDADAVVVLPGWEHSRGACVEVLTAFVTGRPVYHRFPGIEQQMCFSAELFLQLNIKAGGLVIKVESPGQ